MTAILMNILLCVLLINFTVLTGCMCVQFIEDLCERREQRRQKANRKDNLHGQS